MHHTRLAALAVAVVLAITACSQSSIPAVPSASPLPTALPAAPSGSPMPSASVLPTLVASASAVPSMAPATPNPTTGPAPTQAGLEPLVVPNPLDRDLTDTPAMQALRKQFVADSIAPVVSDPRVLAAMGTVPRQAFVPTQYVGVAYEDRWLPIGYGQTISQPSTVAQMTQLLQVKPGDRVLEIGTGSGYQAAILAQLTDQVYSVEIVPQLAGAAYAVLEGLGYMDRISLKRDDGYWGWTTYAPFDEMIVTAAPDHLPTPLVNQLSPNGGRMVIPIGPQGDVQTLWLVTRNGDKIQMQRELDVSFVPFTRAPNP